MHQAAVVADIICYHLVIALILAIAAYLILHGFPITGSLFVLLIAFCKREPVKEAGETHE